MYMHKKAVFLDKDGTLIPDIPYNTDTNLISLEPFAAEGLQMLAAQGFELIIITNQPGIARGLISPQQFHAIHMKIRQLLTDQHLNLAGFYYCPHSGEEKPGCVCRKPASGLIHQAAMENEILLTDSWMIGDILNDVEAGKGAGCRAILIHNGNETEWVRSPLREPDFMVSNLKEAAEIILENSIRL
jgi:D-glycero-D-manno-heptose 1,7-bisphosphate phosphatase